MELTEKQLFEMLGRLYAEANVLRTEVQRLQAQIAEASKE